MLVFENTNDEAAVFGKRNDVITHRPEFSNLSQPPFDRLTSVVIRLCKTKSNSKSRSHEFQEKQISICDEC